MLNFLIGLFVGFFIGSWIMLYDAKDKVVKGLIPFIDASGSMAWKDDEGIK